MANGKDRRTIENIIREPLTRHRFELNNMLRTAQSGAEDAKPFDLEALKKFMGGIKSASAEFKAEILNVLEAVQTGVAPQTPKFDTPEKQLIWGAGFAYLTMNPDAQKTWTKPVEEPVTLGATALWKQVVATKVATAELLSHGQHVQEALRDKAIKYAWGEPGTGFSYNRQTNVINIDLMQTMIVGFEHARADVYREIGHALLSVTYPKRMQEVYKEMVPLLKKSRLAQAKKGPKLKPDEYKQLRMLSAEWQLRQMMFNAAEENVANKFVSNMGKQVLQDYSVSLNNTAVTNRAIGLTRLPTDENASEELRRYMNLCNTIQLSFFQNNALFENTDAGWQRVGIDPNMVRKTETLAQRPDDAKDDDDGVSHADFKFLRELCGGPKGLENLQPRQQERLFGWGNLMASVGRFDSERKAIIEQILKLYGEDLIKKILTQANDQIDQQMKEAKEKQQQDGQDGDDQDQDQDGQDQDGQQGQGKPQKGQKGKKGKPQRGNQQGEPGDMDDMEDGDESDGDDQDQDGQEQKGDKGKKGQKDKKDKDGKKDKKDKKDKGQKGDKGDEEDGDENQGDGQEDGQDGEEQDGQGAEGKLGADDQDSVPVDGMGDMPSVENTNEKPSDEVDPSADGEDADGEGKDGQDADGDDADGSDGQDIDELQDAADKAAEAEDAEEGQEGQEADGQDGEKGQKAGQKQGGKKPGQGGKKAGHGDGKSLGDLAKLDWADYPKRIAELQGPIQRVRKIFKEIQKRQLQRKSAVSRTLDLMPENGEVKERFNAQAHRDMTIKKLAGALEKQDLARFHKDEDKMVPTELDIYIMIDGSGSMDSGRGGARATPLQSALQASAILYEAASAKDMKMNVYVGMWGNSEPPILIRPGDDRTKVGQAMVGMHKGLHSGTDFAPSVRVVAEEASEQRGRTGTLSGFTHVLVLSDGDINDPDKSLETIKAMFEYNDKVTFDAAIIGDGRDVKMANMAKSIKSKKPYQEMGIVVGDDPNEVPMAIVGLLLDKVRKCGSFTAVPNSKKRRAMKKALNKMDRKP